MQFKKHGPASRYKTLVRISTFFTLHKHHSNGYIIMSETTATSCKENKGNNESPELPIDCAHDDQISHRPNHLILPQCQRAGLAEVRDSELDPEFADIERRFNKSSSSKSLTQTPQRPLNNEMLLAYRRKQEAAYVPQSPYCPNYSNPRPET